MTPPLDVEAVEAALKWHGIALAELLPVWGVRVPERWPDHPMVRDFLTLTAAQVLRAQGERRGLSPTAALREACEGLGLNPETVRSRLRDNATRYVRAREQSTKSGGNPTEIAEKAM